MIGTLRRGEDEKVRENFPEAIGGRPRSGEEKPGANSHQVSGEGKPVADSRQVSEQAESLVANSPQVSNSRLNSGEVSFDRRSGA